MCVYPELSIIFPGFVHILSVSGSDEMHYNRATQSLIQFIPVKLSFKYLWNIKNIINVGRVESNNASINTA